MYLEKLHILNFKNYGELSQAFIPGINCLTGPNGSGKTNLLDAIHYLCLTKSFLNPIDSQSISHNQPFMVVEGHFQKAGNEDHIYLGLKRNSKKNFKKNKKDYEKLSDHIGQYPAVVIAPQDSELVTGGSEERRKFTDSLISQYDKTYLAHLLQYHRVLAQRNALLKKFYEERRYDALTLEVITDQLIHSGEPVQQERKRFLDEFLPVFEEYYRMLAPGAEVPGLTYETKTGPETTLKDLMQESLEKDKLILYTTEGPHREDLDFSLNGYSLKKYGSQGQQKSFLVALKLAEHAFLSHKSGFSPILLLDDIFDKMDIRRVTRLVEIVSAEGFGQVFITDTGKEHIRPIFDNLGVTVNFIDIGH